MSLTLLHTLNGIAVVWNYWGYPSAMLWPTIVSRNPFEAFFMHYLRQQCVIQWPTMQQTIFNTNYDRKHGRKAISFQVKNKLFIVHCNRSHKPTISTRQFLNAAWSAVLECGMWYLYSLSHPPPRLNSKSLSDPSMLFDHAHTFMDPQTHTKTR